MKRHQEICSELRESAKAKEFEIQNGSFSTQGVPNVLRVMAKNMVKIKFNCDRRRCGSETMPDEKLVAYYGLCCLDCPDFNKKYPT
jgi:hypothetical protein